MAKKSQHEIGHMRPGKFAALPWVRLWFSLIALGLIAALLGLLWDGQASSDSLAQARQTGVISIGYAVEAPYAFLTPDMEVTGESPEIARLIAARLGIPRVEWRLVEFDTLIEGLESGRFDVIAAGMFITPERQQRVAFSRPTFQVGPGLLVHKGNPLALHSYSDLVQRTNARIAVLSGAAEETRLLELGCPEGRLIRVPNALAGRVAVRSGQADALALSAPTLQWMVMNPVAGLTEMASPFEEGKGGRMPQPALGGFAFRKDDRALLRVWNTELDRYLGSDDHLRLVRKFGFTTAELPPSVTAFRSVPKP